MEGVGAAAEKRLADLEPLIAFYEQEMGTFAGRLMLAVNFLRDAQNMKAPLTPEVKAALEGAEALTVSVMTRLLALTEDEGRGGCDCEGDCEGVKEQAQAWFDKGPRS